MELDEYKLAIRHKPTAMFSHKAIPELGHYLQGRAQSVIDTIKNSLKLEIGFALLFFIFDCYLLIFSGHNFMNLFALILLAFCSWFIFFLIRLLRHIESQSLQVMPVRRLLESYINIIKRFTGLYFQLTMIMIPMVFFLTFLSRYLYGRSVSNDLMLSFSAERILIYLGVSVIWSFLMYFFTRWYIKKMYGNHLGKLKKMLRDLEQDA